MSHIFTVLCSAVIVYYLASRLSQRKRVKLPPGPKGLPIIGNIYDIPDKEQWLAFMEMSEKYNSGIISLNICGASWIIVNSREIATELFGKAKESNYVDRPRFTMLNELAGFDWDFAFMRYGPSWKEHRALLHKEFNPPTRHYPTIKSATQVLLSRLLEQPDNFKPLFRYMTGAHILSMAYGIDAKELDDPYLTMVQEGGEAMAEAGATGFLVDSVPWLKYVPSWLPGARFKTQARHWKEIATEMRAAPFKFAKSAMKDGTAELSIALRHLRQMEDDGTLTPHKEKVLEYTLAMIYLGSSDTTLISLTTFVLAMVQNPTILKKAQAAIDQVLGGTRLPDFEDRHTIPYVDALIKEVLRWRVVGPLGVPHRAIRDDECHGFHIPAGSIIVGNIWALLHDTSMYGDDVDTFRPERFLKDGVLDPEVAHPSFVFGFGTRRSCPGRDMAEAVLWQVITSIIATFDIVKAVDENGVEIDPPGTYSSGLGCFPDPFPCIFRPRSAQAEAMIRAN
ncbi:cytochrome P450 [Mycena floridula]|nr:cytochrome P450 [Mycena floridula]